MGDQQSLANFSYFFVHNGNGKFYFLYFCARNYVFLFCSKLREEHRLRPEGASTHKRFDRSSKFQR